MRRLLFLLVLGTAIWSGYWFIGSSAVRQGAEQWFADLPAQGITARKSALSVTGFPNRFDLTVEGLLLAHPKGEFGWEAPFAQVFAMTWKPWHIIAALPPEQKLRLPDQELVITTDGLLASLRASPTTDLPLAAAVAESGVFRVTSSQGWTAAAEKAVASVRAVEGQASAYDLALDIAGLAPDPVQIAALTAKTDLPATVSVIHMLARATLTAPLNRHAGNAQPQLAALQVTETLITWGALSITASGGIAPDAEGFAAGRIDIDVTNWDRLVPVLVASGAIKPELAPTVQNMLGALANEGGDPAVLKLPLVFAKGRMSLGPLPLGPAPMLMAPTG